MISELRTGCGRRRGCSGGRSTPVLPTPTSPSRRARTSTYPTAARDCSMLAVRPTIRAATTTLRSTAAPRRWFRCPAEAGLPRSTAQGRPALRGRIRSRRSRRTIRGSARPAQRCRGIPAVPGRARVLVVGSASGVRCRPAGKQTAGRQMTVPPDRDEMQHPGRRAPRDRRGRCVGDATARRAP